MDEIQKIAWIDCYLRGDLEEDEKERFEAQYRNDPEFAKEVDLLREIRDVAGNKDLLALSRNLKSTFKSLDTAPGTLKPSKLISLPLILAAAAAITLVIAAVYWFRTDPGERPLAPVADQPKGIQHSIEQTSPGDSINNPGSISPDRPIKPPSEKNYLALARSYYKSPDFPADNTQRGNVDTFPQSVIQQLYQLYAEALRIQSANPQKASETFQKALALSTSAPDSVSRMARYLSAHTRYQLGLYDSAARDFEFVSKVDNPEQNKAKWYQALCLLSSGSEKNSQARKLLEEIATGPSSAHKSAAQELLAKIQFR